MSNAKVTPNLKGPGSAVRRARNAAAALTIWKGPPAVSLRDASQPLSLDQKVPATLPLSRLNRVIAFVDANLALDLCVPRLAAVAGMSPYYFCRSFKQSTGTTPHRYVLQRRMEHAKRLLDERSGSLMQVAHQVGFLDQSQFTRVFHKIVGVTPSDYRKMRAQRPFLVTRSN